MMNAEPMQEQAKILREALGNRWAKVGLLTRADKRGGTEIQYWIVGDEVDFRHFQTFFDLKQAVQWFVLCASAENKGGSHGRT